MRSTSLQKVFDNKLDLYFLLFFVLQPFIDIYKAFWGDTLQLGPFAVEELLNLLLVLFLLIPTVLRIAREKQGRSTVKYIVYFALIGLYLILHSINIHQFDQRLFPAPPSILSRKPIISSGFTSSPCCCCASSGRTA